MTLLLVARQPGAESIATTIAQAAEMGTLLVRIDQRRGDRRRGKALDVGKRASQRRKLKALAYVAVVVTT